jgi:hypothetical protein
MACATPSTRPARRSGTAWRVFSSTSTLHPAWLPIVSDHLEEDAASRYFGYINEMPNTVPVAPHFCCSLPMSFAVLCLPG